MSVDTVCLESEMKGMREAVTCALCTNVYQAAREPLLLPCGHTFCRTCLAAVNITGSFYCPTCMVTHTDLKMDQLYVSHSILQLSLGYDKSTYETCSEHGDDLRYWCCSCEMPLCSLCLYSGHPQGHGVKLASSYIQEKRKALETEIYALDEKIKERRMQVRNSFSDFLEEVFVILNELCQSNSSMLDFKADLFRLLRQVRDANSIKNIITAEAKLRSFYSELKKAEEADGDDNPDASAVESERKGAVTVEETPLANLEDSTNKLQETCSDDAMVVHIEEAMTDTDTEAVNVHEQLSKDNVASVVVQDKKVVNGSDNAGECQGVILIDGSDKDDSQQSDTVKCDNKEDGKSKLPLFTTGKTLPPTEASVFKFGNEHNGPKKFKFGSTAATVLAPAPCFSFGTGRENTVKENREISTINNPQESRKKQEEDEVPHARLNWQDGRILLHCLSGPMDTCLSLKMPSEVFLELKTRDVCLGRVYIRLWCHLRRAQQFLALCLGTVKSSYLSAKATRVINKGEDKESLAFRHHTISSIGNVPSSLPLLTELEFGKKYMKPLKEGFVMQYNTESSENYTFSAKDKDHLNNSGFVICTRDDPGLILVCPFGEVVSGLDVVRQAVRHNPVTDVTITQCGLVMPDFTRSVHGQSRCSSPASLPAPRYRLRTRVRGRLSRR